MKLFGQISAGTIARTACLALALTNQILSATGHPVLPIEDSQLETLVTTGFTVARWRHPSPPGGKTTASPPRR